MQGSSSEDFVLEETKPRLAVEEATGDKLKSTADLVKEVIHLYVRVVKAKDLFRKDVVGTYVEINIENFKRKTRLYKKKSNPKWSQVFTFTMDHIPSNMLEATLKSKNDVEDHFLGRVLFVITASSGTRPSPQWYRLEDKEGNTCNGQLMLAVWLGTQANEAFPDSLHINAATSNYATDHANIRSKVYITPKLWCLRINVIETDGFMVTDKTFVKAVLGNQTLTTTDFRRKSNVPEWNKDLMFVAAEPFEESLNLSVVDRVAPDKDEVLGSCAIPLKHVDIRLDHKPLNSKWYKLVEDAVIMERGIKEIENARIHLRICFEGGYHVSDECIRYSSDFRPTAKELWKSSIGVLEVGILSAQDLLPLKIINGRGTTDAYCVVKYGKKWIRTRTIMDSLAPKWNEQYKWEVFDPCTVITIGVFDNCQPDGDKLFDPRIGKVRIRLSTLETDRIYSHLYPLLCLYPSGVKKMGEIHLAIRFTCTSWINMIHMYTQPLLPKMHYVNPLTPQQIEQLEYQALCIVVMRLSRAEPPLQRQVVEFMLDTSYRMWSIRRAKAAFFRIMSVMSGLIRVSKWFDEICCWKKPGQTILVHILFLVWVLYPVLFLPTIFLYLFFIGVYCYRWRPRHPLSIHTGLSCLNTIHPDELDEEFDKFPTSRPADIVRMRYDRLRSIAQRVVSVTEDLASSAEKLESFLNWRDTRATAISVVFCLVAAIIVYWAPLQLALLTVFYILRHPRLRQMHPTVPSLLFNFLRRLPSRNDCML